MLDEILLQLSVSVGGGAGGTLRLHMGPAGLCGMWRAP